MNPGFPSRLLRAAKSAVPEPVKRQWHGFRWPLRWVNILPGNSRWFGPPRRWVRAESYCRWHGGRIVPVLPAQAMPAFACTHCGPIPDRFFARLQPDVPAAGLLELDGVRVVGPDGWIVGERDSYIIDASFWSHPDPQMDPEDHYLLIPRRVRPLRRLPGRTLSLASDFAIGGFGHFIHDSLTRLLLVERAGLKLDDFDWVYWPHPDTSTARELVQRSGVRPEQLIGWDGRSDLHCEHLTATTFPGRPGHVLPVYAEFLRRRFAPAPAGRDRRIYLSRQGYRRNFRNAAELDALLARRGFETCLAHEHGDVLARCAAARHVVAIEGASFFNVFACPPHTRALLVLPDAGPTMPYTLTLGAAAGLDLFLLAAHSLDQPQVDPGIAEIHLAPDALADALDRMEAA